MEFRSNSINSSAGDKILDKIFKTKQKNQAKLDKT